MKMLLIYLTTLFLIGCQSYTPVKSSANKTRSAHRMSLAEMQAASDWLAEDHARSDAKWDALRQQQAIQQAQQQAADGADWARIRQDTQFEELRMQNAFNAINAQQNPIYPRQAQPQATTIAQPKGWNAFSNAVDSWP